MDITLHVEWADVIQPARYGLTLGHMRANFASPLVSRIGNFETSCVRLGGYVGSAIRTHLLEPVHNALHDLAAL